MNEYINYDNATYYERNFDKITEYNHEYYIFKKKLNNIIGKKKINKYNNSKYVMCTNCGKHVKEIYLPRHVKNSSCINPKKLHLKKRHLLNLQDKIDSDSEEYYYLNF